MTNTTSTDIIIFTNGNLFSRIILERFLQKYKSRISMVVIVSGDYYGNKGFKALLEFFKVTSWIYVFYKIWTILLIKILRFGNQTIITSVDQLCNSCNIPICFVSDINENLLFARIEKLRPEYLISVSCPQLIRQKWLKLVNNKGINIHSSLLPKYGGLAPYFWVLVNGETETGISVHYLVKGFDKGNILNQTKITIEKGTSSFNLFFKLCLEGKDIIMDAFEKMENSDKGYEQDHSAFTYYSHPTTLSYFKLKQNGFSLFSPKDFKIIKEYLQYRNIYT